jgi:hypothetical protein
LRKTDKEGGEGWEDARIANRNRFLGPVPTYKVKQSGEKKGRGKGVKEREEEGLEWGRASRCKSKQVFRPSPDVQLRTNTQTP